LHVQELRLNKTTHAEGYAFLEPVPIITEPGK